MHLDIRQNHDIKHQFAKYLKQQLPYRFIAIDAGLRTLGIAILHSELGFAMPLQTIIRSKQESGIQAIINIIVSHRINGVVVGLPIDTEMGHARHGHPAIVFGTQLSQALSHDDAPTVPVAFYDERFTSMQAYEVLYNAGMKPAQQRAANHKVAAHVILDDFMHWLKSFL